MNHHDILEKIRNIINSATAEINMIIDNEIFGGSDIPNHELEKSESPTKENTMKPVTIDDFINPKFKGTNIEPFLTGKKQIEEFKKDDLTSSLEQLIKKITGVNNATIQNNSER